MNTRILFAVVVSMFVCHQVHAQDDDPVMPEATELEGTWQMVSCVMMGGSVEGPFEELFGRFEGNRMYSQRSGDEGWGQTGTFSVDPSAMPAEIDIENSFKTLGIYEIDGDLLRICIGFGGENEPGNRPGVFESPKYSPTILMVYRRVTEDDE